VRAVGPTKGLPVLRALVVPQTPTQPEKVTQAAAATECEAGTVNDAKAIGGRCADRDAFRIVALKRRWRTRRPGVGKGPQFKTNAASSKGRGRVRNLSTRRMFRSCRWRYTAKAKAEARYRFYVLYDKISREEILAHAWAQCCSTRARRARTVRTSRMSRRTACSGGSANWRLRSCRKPYRPDRMTGVADASGQHVAVQAGLVHVDRMARSNGCAWSRSSIRSTRYDSPRDASCGPSRGEVGGGCHRSRGTAVLGGLRRPGQDLGLRQPGLALTQDRQDLQLRESGLPHRSSSKRRKPPFSNCLLDGGAYGRQALRDAESHSLQKRLARVAATVQTSTLRRSGRGDAELGRRGRKTQSQTRGTRH